MAQYTPVGRDSDFVGNVYKERGAPVSYSNDASGAVFQLFVVTSIMVSWHFCGEIDQKFFDYRLRREKSNYKQQPSASFMSLRAQLAIYVPTARTFDGQI